MYSLNDVQPSATSCRQFVVQHLGCGVADDQVKGVVDRRLARCTAVVVGHRIAQRLPAQLAGKRDHRGGAAAGCRPRAGEEVVGHLRAVACRLVQMAVRVHTAWRDQAATGVDLLRAGAKVCTDRDDAAAANAQVAGKAVAGGGDIRAADDQVEAH
jgi:hypothetical protein